MIDSDFRLRKTKEPKMDKPPKKPNTGKDRKLLKKKSDKSQNENENEKEYFIPYRPSDFHSERG